MQRDGPPSLNLLELLEGELRYAVVGRPQAGPEGEDRSSRWPAWACPAGRGARLRVVVEGFEGSRRQRGRLAGLLRARGAGPAGRRPRPGRGGEQRRPGRLPPGGSAARAGGGPGERAAGGPREPAGHGARRPRRATRSYRPPTRSSSPRTRSCRAPTRSFTRSTRSSTRSTPSTRRRSPS